MCIRNAATPSVKQYHLLTLFYSLHRRTSAPVTAIEMPWVLHYIAQIVDDSITQIVALRNFNVSGSESCASIVPLKTQVDLRMLKSVTKDNVNRLLSYSNKRSLSLSLTLST
jgi:hypothetical protein